MSNSPDRPVNMTPAEDAARARSRSRSLTSGDMGRAFLHAICATSLAVSPLLAADEPPMMVASSSGVDPYVEYAKRVESTRNLTSPGDGLFGDRTSLYNGATEFVVEDIELPGNSELPVRLSRRLNIVLQPQSSLAPYDSALGGVGNWDVEVPHLAATYPRPDGWNASRCSQGSLPPTVSQGFRRHDLWQGISIHVPGQDSRTMLALSPSVPTPTDGPNYRNTSNKRDMFSCIPMRSGLSGEGFRMVAADGLRYDFDVGVIRIAAPLERVIPMPDGTEVRRLIRRDRYYLLASRIADRFGNSVAIAYNAAGHPTRITANDGRDIVLTYTEGRLTSASSHGRNWSYGYDGNGQLTSVVRPDGSSFAYGYSGSLKPVALLPHKPGALPFCIGEQPILKSSFTFTATHPSGATGAFSLINRRHYRSGVHASECLRERDASGEDVFTLLTPHYFDTMSLDRKSLTGPGIPAELTWNYVYATAHESLWGLHSQAPSYPCSTCTQTKTVTVVRPDSSQVRSTFGKVYALNDGRLLKEETLAGDGTVLRSEATHYLQESETSGQPFTDVYGGILNGDDPHTARVRPVTRRVITQSGVNFSFRALSFNEWALPTQVERSSTLGFTRMEAMVWAAFTRPWVLDRLSQITVGSVIQESTEYDADRALPIRRFEFGRPVWQLSYHSTAPQNGLVRTITDALDQTTILDDWHRGVPRLMTHADLSSESAAVSVFGEITSVTDAMGFTTAYGYDSMGRLNRITPPSDGTVTWQPTTIAYTRSASPAYGISAGHWRRTETTGTRVHETFFDGLWRPILQRQSASDDSAGNRFVRRSFNYRGQETFASYPVDSVSSYTAVTTGTSSSYDPLGRHTGTSSISELGTITTSTQYLSPFQVRTTNGRGFSTTTSYQAFDTPSYDFPIQVQQPEGVTTTYARDVFGKPLSLSRSGSYTPPGGAAQSLSIVRRFVYDPQQRLCKTIEPDAGTTVVDYDAASNLLWRASGQNSLSSTSNCQRASVPSSERSLHHYDARNRLLFIDHPSGTDDVGYTWFADGAMHTATTGTLNASAPPAWSSKTTEWTYAYNRRRLLTSESLFTFNRTFTLDHVYNTHGDLEQQTYPSGLVVRYLPNAYGEPRQAGGYARSVSYHPSGAPSAFTYGNDVVRSIGYNTRHLPSRIHDTYSGAVRFDHRLTYDRNANLASLIDGQPNAWETRTLGYDAKDRLTQVNSATQGNETYSYDVLDNLRHYVRGTQDRRFHYSSNGRLDSIRTPNGTPEISFGWNLRGELSSKSRQSFPDQPPPGRIFVGNFESGTGLSPVNFSFDKAGRLVSHLNDSAKYVYDAHGLRVRSWANWVGTRYHVYSRAGKLIYAQDEGRDQRSDFIYLGNTLVAQRDQPVFEAGSTVTYLHSDYRGTPSVETDSNGQLLRRNLLKAYGEPYDGQRREGPGFTKHANDTVLGMVYMQQRYYDPEAMQFISGDSVGANPVSFNRFWYANNNPYKYTDPDGRLPILIPVAIFVAKELASEAVEQATGVPMPTVKNAGRFVFRQTIKAEARDTVRSTRQLRGGSFRSAKEERIREAGGKCEYCQRSDATQGDHARTLNSYKRDVNEGRMTAAEAKEVANSKGNIVGACRECNEVGKGTKDLGTGPGQYQPPNPTERVQRMMDDK